MNDDRRVITMSMFINRKAYDKAAIHEKNITFLLDNTDRTLEPLEKLGFGAIYSLANNLRAELGIPGEE